MKIKCLKIGSRLTWDSKDTTGGLGEAKIICELLSENFEIQIYTKILKNENLNPKNNIKIFNINSFRYDKDDILFIFNGNINFFAGQNDPEQVNIYKIINSFEGKIFYIWIDPELYLKQIWSTIEKKSWSKEYRKEEIEIKRNDINIITSIYNIDNAFEKFLKGKVEIQKENIFYFPFEKYPMLNNKLDTSNNLKYELLYMGTFRGGKRENKLLKYYFDYENIKVDFIGKTKLENFNEKKLKNFNYLPRFNPPINFNEIKYEINKSLCHIVIGDKFYEGNILTPRIYECINFSTVCFLDIDMDPDKRIFKNNLLRNFNYICSKTELENKINKLKSDIALRKLIIDSQREDINFKKQEYLKQIEKIIC